MAKGNDSNKKLSNTAGEATGLVDARYLSSTLTPDGTGNQTYAPIDLQESLNRSFTETWNSTGGYSSREAHDKVELSTSLQYETRNYNIGGYSQTGESHQQTFYNDTSSHTTAGDSGTDIGGNSYKGVARNDVSSVSSHKVSREGSREGVSASENHTFKSSSGDNSEDYGGNLYLSVESDRVATIKGNDIIQVSDGDIAQHVQSGNWDTHVSQKARLYADNDILIESATKITLKVGSSTITITPSSIEILASGGSGRIDINN